MKKKLSLPAIIIAGVFTLLIINKEVVSQTRANPYPKFQVTVYQADGLSVQPNVEVAIFDSNNNIIESGITGNDGKVVFSWTHAEGKYLLKAWYVSIPSHRMNGRTTFLYSGAATDVSITLGSTF
ncbi:MAG: hypothetical protein ABI462_11875 [Ignavibacteria bacterium]